MLYIHIPQMLAYIPYMDPMGIDVTKGFFQIFDLNTPGSLLGPTRPRPATS